MNEHIDSDGYLRVPLALGLGFQGAPQRPGWDAFAVSADLNRDPVTVVTYRRVVGPDPAAAFFAENAGWAQGPDETAEAARQRNGTELARAEAWAKLNGYTFDWEEDKDGWEEDEDGTADGEGQQYGCVMRCKHGGVAQSLWAIGFTDGAEPCDPYKRVVEAELASEEMAS